MIEHQNYISNNLEGIKNSKDKDYKVHCSMEGHINQAFDIYILLLHLMIFLNKD